MIRVEDLPVLNATLNGISALLLLGGFVAIKQKAIAIHKRFMLSAFGTSTLFLISYVIYHAQVGSKRIEAAGLLVAAYKVMLFTHIVLAAVLVPLVLVTMIRALRGRFEAHRRLARWTFPIWMYVSVTGVLIYLAVYHYWAV